MLSLSSYRRLVWACVSAESRICSSARLTNQKCLWPIVLASSPCHTLTVNRSYTGTRTQSVEDGDKFSKRNFGQAPRESRGWFQKGRNEQYTPKDRGRVFRYQNQSGTSRAQDALKSVIMKVKTIQPSLTVSVVDQNSGKLVRSHLLQIANGIDLSVNGLKIVSYTESDAPIVRLVKVNDMVKTFLDDLAAAKEQELLEMGSTTAMRSIQQRAQAEKKRSATKLVTLAWTISASDLMNQKKKEIMTRTKRGERFVIFVGEKSSFYDARNNLEKEDGISTQLYSSGNGRKALDEEEHLIEMKKRELLYTKLQEILEELECKFEVSGSMEGRLMIRVTPKVNQDTKVTVASKKLSSKEERKLKRAHKAKKAEVTGEKKDADLDSLYSFKIDE